jgi:hypothetical protein
MEIDRFAWIVGNFERICRVFHVGSRGACLRRVAEGLIRTSTTWRMDLARWTIEHLHDVV